RAIIRLNALREDLNFFDSSLYRPISARNLIACYILLDYRVSYTFVSIKTAYCLGGRIYKVRAVDYRVLKKEEKGTLNLLIKKDVYRALKDKNIKYIVFYTTSYKDLTTLISDPYLARLLEKFADVFLNNLPKELSPKPILT
ncbi:hypothetical protein N7527_005571, partial [Penicillium freii]